MKNIKAIVHPFIENINFNIVESIRHNNPRIDTYVKFVITQNFIIVTSVLLNFRKYLIKKL